MRVRLADPDSDAGAVAAIYRPVVEDTHISFEEDAPDPVEMAGRMRRTLQRTPWLVAEEDGEVVGYAYAAPHRDRPAYRWSVDVSAYVAPDRTGRGIGRRLYDELLELLDRQGFVNVYAGISLPNPASVALHRAVGMILIGVYEQVGYKHGEWWHVAWYGRRLREPTGPVAAPLPLPRLPDWASRPPPTGP